LCEEGDDDEKVDVKGDEATKARTEILADDDLE